MKPTASICTRIPEIETRNGVIDAALWVDYAWAGKPRYQAAVVVTDDDRETTAAGASELIETWWATHDDFCLVSPTDTLDSTLAMAFAKDAPRPFVISDPGDNPTVGGTGDVSWTARELLTHPGLIDGGCVVIHVSIFDPEVVAACFDAGVDGTVDVRVGGNINAVAPPAEIRGEVFSLTEGDPVVSRQVVARCGSVYVIIMEHHKPFHLLDDFRQLGLGLEETGIVLVKTGYPGPELLTLAEAWVMALTPGGVGQDLLWLGYRNLVPGTWPFDRSNPGPDLTSSVTR